jgi:hypothetical protein
MCINAVSFFVQAAINYRKIYTGLDELFAQVCDALTRFADYKKNQDILDLAMKRVANDILLQFVKVCKLSQMLLPSKNRIIQIIKTTLFKDDAGVQAALADLAKLVEREKHTTIEFGYFSTKKTEERVKVGFLQNEQGHRETIKEIVEVKEVLNRSEREKQLERAHKILGDHDDKRWKQYTSHVNLAIPGSGDWLFERNDYKSWATADEPRSRVIFLAGEQGCGKTYLLSAAVQNLIKMYPQGKEDMNRHSIASYFFTKAQVNERDAQEPKDEFCTIQAALKALAHQILENDPLYRKHVLGLSAGLVDSTSSVDVLWENLLDIQNEGAVIFFLLDGINELKSSQISELKRVLKLATKSQMNMHMQILVTGEMDIITELARDLPDCSSIVDVTQSNSSDISRYIAEQINSLATLKRRESLRKDVAAFMQDVTKGNFISVGFLLQQIKTRGTTEEKIREILNEAKNNGGILDNIKSQIDHCNDVFSDEDINDLNQLLEWVMSFPYSMTLSQLEAILYIRKGKSTKAVLKDLYDRIRDEFSPFFTLSTDDRSSDPEVTLRSSKIQEHFESLALSEVEDSELETPKSNITKLEVEIIQRFLKNLCDIEMYEKFGFDKFFEEKKGTATRIYVNTDEMRAKVALDCLKVFQDVAHVSEIDAIRFEAAYHFAGLLEQTDLSFLSPKLKSEIGKRLICLFTNDDIIKRWTRHGYLLARWPLETKHTEIVLKWLRDSAVSKLITQSEKEWVKSLDPSSETGSFSHLLDNVVRLKAKQWLFGTDLCIEEGEEDSSPTIFQSFLWVRVHATLVGSVPEFEY